MKRLLSATLVSSAIVALVLAPACGGGGDGGTPPVTVASVVITAPVTAPTFATIGRSAQFSAQARDAGDNAISGAAISWSSSNTGAATVSATGLVTAVANGSTQIRASSGGQQSAPVTVTVSQVAAFLTPAPASVTFGAIGSSRQLAASVTDSGGAPVPGTSVTWTRVGPGTRATVSGDGIVTATGVGVGDTAVAAAGSLTAKVPITVTQVTAAIQVTSTSATPDTLFTTTRTRQFSAAARDSNNNLLGTPPAFAWTSGTTGVATVGAATGLVTAVADGNATIQAAVGAVTGTRPVVVRRYASTFTLAPPTATISTSAGTQLFTGTAQDSVGTNLTISWLSRATGVASVNPASGTSTTATGTGNGSTYIVMSAGTRLDSASLTVSNQSAAPNAIAVNLGDNFFRSVRNNTQNPAVDTVAAGGTVTWTWVGVGTHSVESTGSPSFTSSAIKTSGTHAVMFNTVGTYTYDCVVHGVAMSGTIVVR